MGTLEMTHVDLECGGRSSAVDEEEEEVGSVCSSDVSCKSQFYSIADGDGSYDDIGFGCRPDILEDECESVDLESGGKEENNVERDCRICHLSLVSSSPGSGLAIELGCSCKDDLGAAHKHCAETWFKIKGNKTCEICHSVAYNVVGPIDTEAAQQATEGGAVAGITPSGAAPSSTETRACLNGHRFLNFLLGCMVFAFVISWVFHFNIPS